MSPAEVFTPLQLQAIEEIVEKRLHARAPAVNSPAAPELISPEEASRRLGGHPSADTIRTTLIEPHGPIPRRLGGRAGAKRPSYLVTVDEVLAALEASGKPPAVAAPVDLEAARARARGKARGGR